MSGKLPGARARPWRFAQGYLKKTGDSAKVVDRAKAVAQTKPGTVGIKVSILSPNVVLTDKIVINEELLKKIKENSEQSQEIIQKPIKKKKVKKGENKNGKA